MKVQFGCTALLVAAKKGQIVVVEKIACHDSERGQALGVLAENAYIAPARRTSILLWVRKRPGESVVLL